MALVELGPLATAQCPDLATFRHPFDGIRLVTPRGDAGVSYEWFGEALDPLCVPGFCGSSLGCHHEDTLATVPVARLGRVGDAVRGAVAD